VRLSLRSIFFSEATFGLGLHLVYTQLPAGGSSLERVFIQAVGIVPTNDKAPSNLWRMLVLVSVEPLDAVVSVTSFALRLMEAIPSPF